MYIYIYVKKYYIYIYISFIYSYIPPPRPGRRPWAWGAPPAESSI